MDPVTRGSRTVLRTSRQKASTVKPADWRTSPHDCVKLTATEYHAPRRQLLCGIPMSIRLIQMEKPVPWIVQIDFLIKLGQQIFAVPGEEVENIEAPFLQSF